LRYYLQRKQVVIGEESERVWLSDRANAVVNAELSRVRHHQLKKKADLLNGRPESKEKTNFEMNYDFPTEELEIPIEVGGQG
jgi:hypothetical protein